MRETPDVERATPTLARRRSERRIRSFFRHEQMAVQMAVVSAQHSAQRCCSIATQTDDFVLAATSPLPLRLLRPTQQPLRHSGRIRGSSTRCHLCCTSSCDRVRVFRTCDWVHRTSTSSDLSCFQSTVTFFCLHHDNRHY